MVSLYMLELSSFLGNFFLTLYFCGGKVSKFQQVELVMVTSAVNQSYYNVDPASKLAKASPRFVN